MLPGSLSTSAVQALTTTILVNGVQRYARNWSVSRSIRGQMPDQVAAGGGFSKAVGSIQWAREQAVSKHAENPWNPSAGWVPAKGDRVEIWVNDSDAAWKQFTGRIDETSGDVGSGAESTLVDDSDRLNARFAHEPLLRIMPPRQDGGLRRGIGLSWVYVMDAALRAAGFYATPKLETRPAMSIPAQGSMWPESGVIVAASHETGTLSHAQFLPAPWGYAASNFDVSVVPARSQPITEPVELTFLVAPDHNGNAFFSAVYGSTSIQLSVAASRTVIGRLNGTFVGSFALGSATAVSLLVEGSTWTFRTNTGDTIVRTAAVSSSSPMTDVVLRADKNSRVAGFQVCHPSDSTKFRPVNYTPSAVISLYNSGFHGLMDALPVIKQTKSREVINDISNKTLTAAWLDETGMFRAVPSDALRSAESVLTINTLDHVRKLSWRDSLLSTRSSASVDFLRPEIDLRIYDNISLHQGSGETLSSGQRSSLIISPADDEDWIGVDTNIYILGEAGSAANSNAGRGSITGAVVTDGTTELPGSGYITASLTQIAPSTYRLIQQAGALPPGYEMELRYPSTSTTIWPRWLGRSFAIIRGYARVGWYDDSYTDSRRGPEWAPALSHDAGAYLSRTDNVVLIDRVARFLADQALESKPFIPGLEVRYDPRLQLGDVITVESRNFMGVSLTCLVVEKTSGSAGSFTLSLGVVVLSARTTFTTYAEFEAAHSDTLTYEQWRVLFPATATYTDFNNDPLRGA